MSMGGSITIGTSDSGNLCDMWMMLGIHVWRCSMSMTEKIKSNAEVHGVAWAAAWAARNGVNISTVRKALFGRY